MTNKDKKLAILRMLDAHVKSLFRVYLVKKADEEAAKAGARQWERENPDDGVGCFSMNKWNPQGAEVQRMDAERDYKYWQTICDYALEALVE